MVVVVVVMLQPLQGCDIITAVAAAGTAERQQQCVGIVSHSSPP